MLNEISKYHFIDEVVDIALFATQTPLSIFTNLLHQKFEKHSMLESRLEILQQFYIQMESKPKEFRLFPGDLSTHTLRCIRCGQPVTLACTKGVQSQRLVVCCYLADKTLTKGKSEILRLGLELMIK
jgi:hypothetical protein